MPAVAALPAALPADIRAMNKAAAWLAASVLLLSIIIGVRWFIRLPVFSIQSIHIDGETAHNTATSLRSHVLGRIEGNVFTMNLMQAKHAFESAPWVRRAVVRRVWPNRLSVTLEEHRPIAYWDEADRTAEQLIDNFGDVFEVNMADVEEQTLPQLSGPPDAASQMLSMMQRLNERFAHLPAQIDRLELNERGSWRAILDTEAQIELGRGTEPEVLPRVEAFVSTLPQVTTRYRAALLSADLRHRDGYAVRLKDVYTGENALRDKSRGKSHPSY